MVGIAGAMDELTSKSIPRFGGALVSLGDTATPAVGGVISILKDIIGQLADLAGWATTSGIWSAKAVTAPA